MNNVEFELHCPISKITTYKTQGFIPAVIYPKNITQCKEVIKTLSSLNLSYFVIGNGSNLLINPNTTKVCISLKKMNTKAKLSGNKLTLPASFPIAAAIPLCKKAGVGGLESIATIPACVGGLVKNNASFYGQSAFDHLEKITLLHHDKIYYLKKENIPFSYRKTQLPSGIILSATFHLPSSTSEEIDKKWKDALAYRNQVQPKGFSCGCVFKNPNGKSAGQLIEHCGLKGKQKGGAIISPQHANFIINQGNATFDDVKYLIEYCQEEVLFEHGIQLETEVEIIN